MTMNFTIHPGHPPLLDLARRSDLHDALWRSVNLTSGNVRHAEVLDVPAPAPVVKIPTVEVVEEPKPRHEKIEDEAVKDE